MRSALHIIAMHAAALAAVILLAFQCADTPQPGPEPPEPDKTSESLRAFLAKSDIGLYIDSRAIVTYDGLSFQKAWSSDRSSFRIQRDDQGAYMQIRKATQTSSASYQVEYMNENHGVTLIVLRLQPVYSGNSCVWLWNETMKTGIIIPDDVM